MPERSDPIEDSARIGADSSGLVSISCNFTPVASIGRPAKHRAFMGVEEVADRWQKISVYSPSMDKTR